jgi:transposase
MIHHIKSLYAGGDGQSIRTIAEQLQISRNTVRKYLRLSEKQISKCLDDPSRIRRLDAHRDQIIHQLQLYPRLSAVKVLRKLRAQGIETAFSDRTVRRYIQELKQTVAVKQPRYYMPVMDMVPGVQCQVDPGELRGVGIGGKEHTVYFVVFVLSYSRLMHVSVSDRPIMTSEFIQMHDAAFRYFGGCPEECVYDQTKLVVIREEFRELTLNQRFSEYASHARINIRACEGYDPESKGKVEAGVKYVQGDGLYGERFDDWAHLRSYLNDWLDTIANLRIHGTTGVAPRQLYDQDEKARMQPYLSPSFIGTDDSSVTRKVDKTGLIAWKSNKYSVPQAYQRCRVGVSDNAGELIVSDLDSGKEITRHTLCLEKGVVIRNTDHYRDRAQQVADYEQAIVSRIGNDFGQQLCALLKLTSPKIYKDQLAGAGRILCKHSQLPDTVLEHVLLRPRLSVSGLRDYLEAYAENSDRLEFVPPLPLSGSDKKALECYANLTSKEARHELH